MAGICPHCEHRVSTVNRDADLSSTVNHDGMVTSHSVYTCPECDYILGIGDGGAKT